MAQREVATRRLCNLLPLFWASLSAAVLRKHCMASFAAYHSLLHSCGRGRLAKRKPHLAARWHTPRAPALFLPHSPHACASATSLIPAGCAAKNLAISPYTGARRARYISAIFKRNHLPTRLLR